MKDFEVPAGWGPRKQSRFAKPIGILLLVAFPASYSVAVNRQQAYFDGIAKQPRSSSAPGPVKPPPELSLPVPPNSCDIDIFRNEQTNRPGDVTAVTRVDISKDQTLQHVRFDYNDDTPLQVMESAAIPSMVAGTHTYSGRPNRFGYYVVEATPVYSEGSDLVDGTPCDIGFMLDEKGNVVDSFEAL